MQNIGNQQAHSQINLLFYENQLKKLSFLFVITSI